jgi:hypothetical protein
MVAFVFDDIEEDLYSFNSAQVWGRMVKKWDYLRISSEQRIGYEHIPASLMPATGRTTGIAVPVLYE